MPVITKGKQSGKKVDGQTREVVPFVGTDRQGEFSQFGVGIFYADGEDSGKGQIWGLVVPRQPLKSWRAMKLLEFIPEVVHGTLSGCWYAADADVRESDQRYVDVLATQFSNREAFNQIRENVVSMIPSAKEFDAMLKAMSDQGIEFDTWELTPLIEQGALPYHPLVDKMIQADNDRREKYAATERAVKEPVPKEGSLSQFFSDLGIANFIIGGGCGGYGIDWGHIGLEQLDETAKRDSFSEYMRGHRLEHTTQGPETRVIAGGKGVTMSLTSSGEIENPGFLAANGTKYTFTRAVFEDENFHITTKVSVDGESETEEVYTVPQLREMIGPLPPKKPVAYPFWRRFVPGFIRKMTN